MQPDVDLLILGGGCAGLSLAANLSSQHANSPTTLILEKKTHYTNDRTWCFWDDAATPFAEFATHQWSSFTIGHGNKQVHKQCTETPYRMLESRHFYEATLSKIKRAPHMALRLGEPLWSDPVLRMGRWHVDTAEGPVSAKWVVDTRPQGQAEAGGAILWQSFYGHEIECASPVFNPSCADLMDFESEAPDGVAFTYVLPTTPTRALVEYTVFAARPLTADALHGALLESIAARVRGAEFTILRSESGILPMGLTQPAPQQKDASYNRVGLSAGAGRAATGYAFQRIQRWSQRCAAAILSGGLPLQLDRDPFLLRTMDHIFLNVLRSHPKLGPALFIGLFSKVDSKRLIRFLSDQGSLSDCAAVVLALPPGLFLSELFKRHRST
jgi:lycopene beta-cyclase